MNTQPEKSKTKVLAIMGTIIVLLGLWILGTQVFSIIASKSASLYLILTIIASVGLVIGGVIKSKKELRE